MADVTTILLFSDVCRELRISETTGKRRRRAGTFPIPEILPHLDRRPRYSSRDVEAFKARETNTFSIVRRRA